MSPSRPTVLLLVLGSLLLAANPVWLVPHEGDTRYTYERAEITVEDGTIDYHARDVLEFDRQNNLNAVGCEPDDGDGERACAFDRYLVTHDPVELPRGHRLGPVRPEFVHVDGDYYRRIHRPNGSGENTTVTHDVERVSPRTVLDESAQNVSARSRGDRPLELRVAATGDTVTSFARLDEAALGNVYRQNGSYYTVVGTDKEQVDHGLGLLRDESNRVLLSVAGLALLAWTLRAEFGD